MLRIIRLSLQCLAALASLACLTALCAVIMGIGGGIGVAILVMTLLLWAAIMLCVVGGLLLFIGAIAYEAYEAAITWHRRPAVCARYYSAPSIETYQP